MIEIPGLDWLRERLGQELAVSGWVDVGQARIDRFADATEDTQWIHVDPARAAAETRFRGTIAHGFLSLSLVSVMARQAMSVAGVRMAINYGLNRVRFVSPVPAGSRLRGRFTPVAAEEGSGGSITVTWNVAIEREHGDKPAVVAEWLVRYYLQGPSGQG
jgi:acyl dehydratase